MVILLQAALSMGSTTVTLGKARELVERSQYREALPLLEETVLESPQNAEGHFLLAVARMWTGDCERACPAFTRAVELDPGLIGPTSARIKERVLERVGAGDLEGARVALSVAVRHDPGLRREITRSCLYSGEGYLDQGDEALAEELFRFISDIEPQLRNDICELLYRKARSVTGEESLRLVLVSLRYGDRYQEEISRMALRLANDLDDESARENYLKMASPYVDPQALLQASVEYYTRLWGAPGKISLSEPDIWIGVDIPRGQGQIMYLSPDPFLTRGETGPKNLDEAIYRAFPFAGLSTPGDAGYTVKIWFSSSRGPVSVYYWTIPGT